MWEFCVLGVSKCKITVVKRTRFWLSMKPSLLPLLFNYSLGMHDETPFCCCDESENRNKRKTTKPLKCADGFEKRPRILKTTSHWIIMAL